MTAARQPRPASSTRKASPSTRPAMCTIADSGNNRIQEIAAANGTQWGQSMTADDMYTVAGSAAGTSGNAGDGGLATAALMANTESISLDPEGDLYITDNDQRHHPRSRLRHPRRHPARARPDQLPGPRPVRHRPRRADHHPARRRPGHLLGPDRRLVRLCRTWPPAATASCPRTRAPPSATTPSTQIYTFSPSPGTHLHLQLQRPADLRDRHRR